MYDIEKIKNTVIEGDSIEVLKKIPKNTIDMIFTDPPYFMRTSGVLLRGEGTEFKGVNDDWDKFDDNNHYDTFCYNWLKECRRVLKKDGTIWVIGSFQNIYRIGYILQNLGFWILNDIVWSKPNPVPNFRGTRFTNSNETIIWCSKSQSSKYTFNYKTMKSINGGKQMKSVWDIGICIGSERLKGNDGKKIHNTQKPEKLLENIILSSTKIGDIVLDCFFGTGTTGSVSKKFSRNFIGIEREKQYVEVSRNRISKTRKIELNKLITGELDIKPKRVPMSFLIEKNMLKIGDKLYNKDKTIQTTIKNKDGYVELPGGKLTSIHKSSGFFQNKINHNGWEYWYVIKKNKFLSINFLREDYRQKYL